ncbi:MAG: TRAP transporter large permease, partial [Pseudomonadota bacterium]
RKTMIDLAGAVIGFVIMLGLMFIGLHVGVAMLAIGVLGALVYFGPPVLFSFGTNLWSVMNDFLLTTIPLFVLLGELLLRSGITKNMYDSLADWLSRLPGGLLHTNIGACSLFAAVSGSSVATAATIGTVALDEFKRRTYSEPLVLGTIAAGATLGILIPPSVNLIIYGALTNTSIGQLFAAGILPGVLLTLLFMAMIATAALIKPAIAEQVRDEDLAPRRERIRRLQYLLPPLGIFVVVMGAIYGGWATPTEAAALGVVLAFLLAWWNGALSFAMLHQAFIATTRTSALLIFIISAAFFLNFIVGILGVPQAMTRFVTDLGLSATETILLLVLFYLIMGCFLETLSMMVGTIPVVMPIILHLGIDPVWFGIFLVIMMELALITPPVGMNLYVVQGVRGRGELRDVYAGIAPFVIAMLLMVLAIIWQPWIVMVLPEALY